MSLNLLYLDNLNNLGCGIMKYPKSQIFVALCVYIGQIVMGFTLGWTAPIIPKLQDPGQTILPDAITDQEASWIGSIVILGCIGGPYISGFLLNTTGRKPCLFLSAILFSLSFLVLAFASNVAMIYTGRIIGGFGSGIVFTVNLIYIGEMASTKIRGCLITTTAIFTSIGTLMVYSIAPYLHYSVTNYVGFALTGLHMIGLSLIPESPLFLNMKGSKDKATAVLMALGRERDIDELVSTTTQQNTSNLVFEKKQWSDILSIRSNRKAFFILISLFVLQQLSGFVVVVLFTTSIFQLANSSVEPNIATIIVGITQFAGSCLTPMFVERAGRKVLLLVSTAGSCLSLVILGAYFYLDSLESPIAARVTWLPLVTLIFFFFACDFGYSIIPSTFVGEMFTPNVRSTGSTISVTASWLVGFGVSLSFSLMLQWGAHFVFWFYAAMCAIAFLFTVFFVPETKGKSLQEIRDMLNK